MVFLGVSGSGRCGKLGVMLFELLDRSSWCSALLRGFSVRLVAVDGLHCKRSGLTLEMELENMSDGVPESTYNIIRAE